MTSQSGWEESQPFNTNERGYMLFEESSEDQVLNEEFSAFSIGMTESIQQTKAIYDLQVDEFRESAEKNIVSVPAAWVDFEGLLNYAEQRGWYDIKDLSPFDPPQEARDYFDDFTPELIKFANLIRANAANIQFYAMKRSGFAEVDVDDIGQVVYRSTNKAKSDWLVDLVARTVKAMEEHNAG